MQREHEDRLARVSSTGTDVSLNHRQNSNRRCLCDGPVLSTYFSLSLSLCLGSSAPQVRLVPSEDLDSARKALEIVTAVHVYSVQAAPSSQPVDISAQARAKKSTFLVVMGYRYGLPPASDQDTIEFRRFNSYR